MGHTHWYPSTGSMAWDWEGQMSTPPKIRFEYYGIFTFTLYQFERFRF